MKKAQTEGLNYNEVNQVINIIKNSNMDEVASLSVKVSELTVIVNSQKSELSSNRSLIANLSARIEELLKV